MRAHALLRRAKQMNSQQPFIKWNVAILKDSLDRDGELFAASGALPQPLARLANALASGFYFLKRLDLWSDLVGFAH